MVKVPKSYFKGRLCCKCGVDLSEKDHGRRYYDDKKEWDEKSWICEKCYNESEKFKRIEIRDKYYKEKDERLKERRCYICGGSETGKTSDGKPDWRRYKIDKEGSYDRNGYWDRKSHICIKCESMERQKFPDSQNNMMKSISNWRIGELGIYVKNGKGLIGEAIIAKVRNLEIIAIKMDGLRNKIDFSYDDEYGIIQGKVRTFKNGKWNVGNYVNEEIFDYIFLICMDEYWKNIERVYAIPRIELIDRTGFAIVKNPSRPTWYYGYRIDEKHYNDVYHDFIRYLGDKKYFGIEDIKKWLEMN